MLTFNVILGYHAGPPIPILLVIFFRVFFSIWPTDPIPGNALDAKRKKKEGMALSLKKIIINDFQIGFCHVSTILYTKVLFIVTNNKYWFFLLFSFFSLIWSFAYLSRPPHNYKAFYMFNNSIFLSLINMSALSRFHWLSWNYRTVFLLLLYFS